MMKKKSQSSFLKKKIDVAITYKHFIYKLLSLALKSLNIKGLEC